MLGPRQAVWVFIWNVSYYSFEVKFTEFGDLEGKYFGTVGKFQASIFLLK